MPFVSYKLADSFVQEMDDGAAIRDEVSSFLPWGETWRKGVGGFAEELGMSVWKMDATSEGKKCLFKEWR